MIKFTGTRDEVYVGRAVRPAIAACEIKFTDARYRSLRAGSALITGICTNVVSGKREGQLWRAGRTERLK